MKARSFAAVMAVCGLCLGAMAQADKQPLKDLNKQVQKGTDAIKKGVQPDKATGQPSEAEMKAWMEASTPGANHKRLDAFVGEWSVESVTQMAPDAPKETTTGHSSMKWVLDGRFLLQEYSGTMMGMPFHGLGTWGYDNIKKEYVGTWMDSSSTSIMNNTGSYDEATKAWTMKGTFQEPSGQVIQTREVIKFTDANKHTFDFYMTGPDGKEFKSMTLTYTRQSAAPNTKPMPPKTDAPTKK